MGRIVVGVDESAGAAAALRWAVREAGIRDWSVTAVLAWELRDQHRGVVGRPFDPSYGELDARAGLDSIVEATVDPASTVPVDRTVVNGRAAPALIDASRGADLLVVGARGLGGFRGLLVGSVSQQCLEHATCPVVLVRSDHPQEEVGRIVAGIDDSENARVALAWALDAGRAHRATVEVVHAWTFPYAPSSIYGPGLVDTAPLEAIGRSTLDSAVEAADTSGLPSPVTRTLSPGPAARAVLDAAQDADLIVVGSTGSGGFLSIVLGSVSNKIAHGATCPVVVVPLTNA